MLALHPANEDLFAGTPAWAILNGSLREQTDGLLMVRSK